MFEDVDEPPRGRDRRRRLLLITPDFPPLPGGIQTLSHRLALHLSSFEVHVVALRAGDWERFDAASGIATRRARAPARGVRAGNLALNAAALDEARRFRPDATLSMHAVCSPAAATIRRWMGARTVQYFHAKEIPDKPRLSAFAARRADANIAVSSYTAQLIARTGAPPERVRLIPPGVTLPGAHDAGPRPQRPTVLTLARLDDRHKGHDVMIAAMARVREQVRDVQWVVIGQGRLRAELQERAGAAGLDGVARFLGAVDDEQRDRWLAQCDVFALPSRVPHGGAGEGFGIAYLEAAAHGKPVVAGNVAGALDAVADDVTGLLVDPGDDRAVAEAIARLLRDHALAEAMGSAGARRARDFAWPRVAARVEGLLHEQLGASPAAAATASPDGRSAPTAP
jgi:phosphatidyl-myo-inositol dimannoside synthase